MNKKEIKKLAYRTAARVIEGEIAGSCEYSWTFSDGSEMDEQTHVKMIQAFEEIIDELDRKGENKRIVIKKRKYIDTYWGVYHGC
jgi:hypothetical protein